ncbi:ABC transporter ATP-binding protein [Brevibacillus fulvus]|uniref:Carnitine transport ATP-binding protein OpuCA n=1 Tax=Brevibacillus fulvus TaxID=1125967 RepID=A0A938Y0P7_9BACL|nr:ABC transporter ATP-binding protein [Brevibacillus fulvus]MBM7589000.1 sulfate transport system ATP-binding protein [Brevibacillus fulvus]
MHIEVRDLVKTFGDVAAVNKASFQIQNGHLVGLLGPSGGGKTSILRMLAGLEQPTAGEIYFDGKLVNPIPVQDRGIGFVFQHYALFKHMTVFENVAYGLKVKKQKRQAINERVYELLQLIGLEGTENKYPHQLSGGQRQRVAFARALAPKPRLLLLDEPFAAIDAKVRKELRLWLRNLINQFGTTTIFVTHDQDEAMEVADDLIIVQKGRVEQQGAPWDIYNHPASAFVASFIGESNKLKAPVALQGFPELSAYRAGGEWQEGTQVFIRPEAIELRATHHPQTAEAGEPGKITHVHFRGDAWYVEVELAGGMTLFTYQPLHQEALQAGDSVSVFIQQLFVFAPSDIRILENRSRKGQRRLYVYPTTEKRSGSK